MKKDLEKRFNELFKGKRLLAIQLDGFTHNVYFDSGNSNSRIEQEVASAWTTGNGITERATELFKGYSNQRYQGNAVEVIYVYPQDR